MSRARNKLKIACTDTDCCSGLHCFRATDKMVEQHRNGECRECGVVLVDWPRIHKRDLNDYQNTFDMLRKEKIRHFFWHKLISQKAINHAKRKGRQGMRERAYTHLVTAIGAAKPWHDGFQTPMPENADTLLPYAQHATATCCRKCLEYWHGIPQGEALTHEELQYFRELVCLYIEERVPNLLENGEYVPHL